MNEELLKRFDIIANKLGVASEHIYSVLLKEAWLEGFYGIFWIVCGIICTKFTLKLFKSIGNNGYDDDTGIIFLGILSGLAALVMIIIGLIEVTTLFNPEATAIKNFFKLLK